MINDGGCQQDDLILRCQMAFERADSRCSLVQGNLARTALPRNSGYNFYPSTLLLDSGVLPEFDSA